MIVNSSFMAINPEAIEKGKSEAAFAKDNLLVRKDDGYSPKVCCVCDRFIMYGSETSIKLSVLKKKEISCRLSKGQNHFLSEEAKKIIEHYYTVKFTEKNALTKNNEWLKKLYLSPKSYFTGTKGKGDHGLGACVACKSSLTHSRSKIDVNDKPPMYAIANGLMIGPTPTELLALNDVELAMISLARIDRHVFSIEGGAHKQMIGWHSMYANDDRKQLL